MYVFYLIYSCLGQASPEAALVDCDAAIELDPKYIRCLQRRAALREESDRLTEALEDYRQLLNLDPANDKARWACAVILFCHPNLSPPINFFTVCLTLSPNYYYILLVMFSRVFIKSLTNALGAWKPIHKPPSIATSLIRAIANEYLLLLLCSFIRISGRSNILLHFLYSPTDAKSSESRLLWLRFEVVRNRNKWSLIAVNYLLVKIR